jgi:hypothetical protein
MALLELVSHVRKIRRIMCMSVVVIFETDGVLN